jgi:hypothetical protein
MSENYFKRARKSRADCLLGVEIVRRETRIVNLRLDAFFRLDAFSTPFSAFSTPSCASTPSRAWTPSWW